MKDFRNFINGEWVSSARTFENRNPVDNRLIGHVHEAGRAEVDAAVRAARAALAGPWGTMTVAARVDLLVTDIGLPGMNGRELADHARELRPDLKILFITGYAENTAMAGGFLLRGMDMITKPFDGDKFLQRVRDMTAG